MECELARVNFMNHVAKSVPDRTRMWLRMRLHSRRQAQAAAWAAQAAWFAAIPAAFQQPLVEQYWYRRTPTKAHNALMRLLYRACTAAAAPPLQQMLADLPSCLLAAAAAAAGRGQLLASCCHRSARLDRPAAADG